MMAKVRERPAVNKQISHIFHTQIFNLKKFHELEDKEKYRVEVWHRFAALENLITEVEISNE
jgi:hypothetical protein